MRCGFDSRQPLLTKIYKFDFYKKILYNIYRKLRKERKEMASRAKHAQKVAEAQFIRRMVKASEVAANAVDAE